MSIKYKGKTISGPPGADGKSAYEYAVEGGYTGTEDEFKALIASGPWLSTNGGTLTGPVTLPGDSDKAIIFREGDESGYAYISTTADADGGNYALYLKQSRLSETLPVPVYGIETPRSDYGAANKKYVDEKVAMAGGGPYYATCSTAGSTTAKTASCEGFVLKPGAAVLVKFSSANTVASPTLNVSGTGAKYIKKYGTTGSMANMWVAGAIILFVYDGTNWVMENGTMATTAYYGLTKLNDSTGSYSTTEAATANAVRQVNLIANEALTLAKEHTHGAQDVFLSGETSAALGGARMQNIIQNGDFEGGTGADGSAYYWNYDQSEMQINFDMMDSQMVVHPSSAYVYLWQRIEVPADHKYYFRMSASCSDAMATSQIYVEMSQVDLEQSFSLSNKQRTDISAICNGGSEIISIGITSYDFTYIDNVMLVDLTEAFGEGKEPTKEECDQNIVYSGAAYIYKVSVDEALRKIAQALDLGGDA